MDAQASRAAPAMRLLTVILCAATWVLSVGLTSCNRPPPPIPAPAHCTVGSNGEAPVIIVAGTFSPEIANELFLGVRLDQAGYTHCVFELEGDPAVGNLPGTASIDVSAAALGDFVDSVLAWSGANGAVQVDLVGHSQGALVARHYIKFGDGESKVKTMVSLSGPNEGTEVAGLVELFLEPVLAPYGVTCEGVAPCEEMQLGSSLISDLNDGDDTPGNTNYYAFYTDNDLLVWYWGTGPLGLPVIKFDNAELGDGATNVQVDEECPLRFVSHGGMIVDPVVFEMVDDALAGRTIDVPIATCLLPPIPSPI
ncbi:MAG: hypothetical protein WCB63_08485 [Polyangiales bacterium]